MTFAAEQALNQYGCSFDETFVEPCIINGQDRGQMLQQWGNMGYIGIITCPLGLFLIFVYLLILGIFGLVRRSRTKAGN